MQRALSITAFLQNRPCNDFLATNLGKEKEEEVEDEDEEEEEEEEEKKE